MSKLEKIGDITRREYEWLKSFKNLQPHEQKKVDAYEAKHKRVVVPKKKKEVTPSKKILITKSVIWKYFEEFYKAETGREFQRTPESIKNIEPIIKYFAVDDEFFKCENLVKNMNEPSFKKGLLIIGKYGNGKTSILRTLSTMFNHFKMPIRFRTVNSHDLVTEWESISSQGGRHLFFEKYLCSMLHIDDVKKERKASNYGTVEIIRDILEKRYDKKLKTFITCNYRESDKEGNLKDALIEFSRYGNHIYDRLFEMFNIIEFKGKSFR